MSAYVIVDLEMCMIPPGEKRDTFGWSSELIQIGAVLLDDDYEIADTFMTHVAPVFGSVDAYIEKLTGITREDTRNAPCTKDALEAFMGWLPEDAVAVSWSRSDEIQIRKEIEGKQLHIDGLEELMAGWQDCQETFGQRMNTSRNYKLSEALIMCDIDLEDGEHDALVDARNTAKLFAKMQRESQLTLSRYLISEEETKGSAYNPFAELLKKMNSDT